MSRAVAVGIVGIALLFGAGCNDPEPVSSTPPTVATVIGEAPPYEREAFGSTWARVRGNCDTREIALQRASGATAVDTDADGCRDDGLLIDPYTGNAISPAQTEIDHVFSLSAAWRAGAWQWTDERRREFANDPENLLAVTDRVNEAKGDKGPDEWAPPARSGWCTYSITFWRAATKYDLAVTPEQGRALDAMQATCPPASG